MGNIGVIDDIGMATIRAVLFRDAKLVCVLTQTPDHFDLKQNLITLV